MGLLQERIEELGSAIISLQKDKVYIDGFYNDVMLNKWLQGSNCRKSMGMYELSEYKLDFSRIPDNSIVIVKKDDDEIARFQYVPFYKGAIKYDNESGTDISSKTLSRLFTLRKCKYTKKYNLIYFTDKDNNNLNKVSASFENIDDVENYFKLMFKNFKLYKFADKKIQGILKDGFEDVRKNDID